MTRRRQCLQALPALTRFYGLKPWEIELLTVEEFEEFVRFCPLLEEREAK